MLPLSFPQPDFQVRKENEQPQIFDRLRKRWVKLTPEEWVRQNMISMLTETLGISSAYIGVEKEIIIDGLKKRFDLLVYDKTHTPWMLIECKASTVTLSESTAEQLLRYHRIIQAKHLIITNGNEAMGWEYHEGKIMVMNNWPVWG
jgi:hypothetical protein